MVGFRAEGAIALGDKPGDDALLLLLLADGDETTGEGGVDEVEFDGRGGDFEVSGEGWGGEGLF